jgi:hypothetical protein
VLGLVTRSRAAAVSLSDGFSYETIQSPTGETMDVSDFAELWGDAHATYAAAYRILGDQNPWSMAVRPGVTALPPEEALYISCGLKGMEVEYRAFVPAGGASLVQQTLRVSPNLEVRSIELERSGSPEPLRWTRPAPDRIVAFLSEPLAGDYRLIAVFTAPVLLDADVPIPAVTMRPGENLPQHVQIHRQPECLVEIQGLERNPSSAEFATINPWGTDAYLVEAFRDRPGADGNRSLEIHRNPAVASAQSVTQFDPAVGVSFVSRIRVQQGVLDRLTLEVPADWIGPLDVSPPARIVEGDTSQGRRQMQIHLIQPVPAGQEFELRFNGSLAVPAGGAWVVPVLRLMGPESDGVFVAVNDAQPVAAGVWQLDGAIAAELPQTLQQVTFSPRRVFRVEPAREANYIIRRLPAAQASVQTSLAMADVLAYVDEQAAQVQRTQFMLPPLESRALILQWPDGHEPIAVYLEHRLLTPLPVDSHRWRLPIGPTDLPIALTTISRSSESSADRVSLHRPRLWESKTEYTIPLTLWTVAAPRTLRVTGGATASAAVREEVSVLRLARLTQLVTAAESRLSSLSAADRSAWIRHWTDRLRAEGVALEQSAPQATVLPDQSTVAESDRVTREQLISQLNQLLGRLVELGETNKPVADDTPAPAAPFASSGSPQQHTYFVVGGSQSNLDLQSDPNDQTTAIPEAAITLALVAAVGVLLRAANTAEAAHLLANHPQWLVAALGLIFALLGFIFVGAAFITAAVVSGAAVRWLERRVGS